VGRSSSITGSAVTRAAGGSANGSSAAGAVNTGNGGSGGLSSTNGAGGAGGKGVVILRQLNTQKFPSTLTGAITTTTATHLVFTFNDSGTIGWTA
jgi:hypothetical protein